jgi:hypothetical protein
VRLLDDRTLRFRAAHLELFPEYSVPAVALASTSEATGRYSRNDARLIPDSELACVRELSSPTSMMFTILFELASVGPDRENRLNAAILLRDMLTGLGFSGLRCPIASVLLDGQVVPVRAGLVHWAAHQPQDAAQLLWREQLKSWWDHATCATNDPALFRQLVKSPVTLLH